MTLQEQTIAIAELDGKSVCEIRKPSWWREEDYSTRDAVIAVIEKQCQSLSIRVDFLNSLRMIIPGKNVSDYQMLLATPSQLREALLRATGKWKE